MKTQQEIEERLDKILKDDRLSYPPANVQINAPLALIQVQLESMRSILLWVLDHENRTSTAS